MPRLTGGVIRQAAADEVSSRQSNHSMLFNQKQRRYNHSTDLLTPINRDTMRMTGTNILGPQASANILLDKKSKVGPIDYKINQCLNFAKTVKNRFGDITIADMCDTTASAQFDGACDRY